MKKNILAISLIALVTVFTACKKSNKSEADTKESQVAAVAAETAVKYTVDSEASTLAWKGFKPTGEHTGTVNISNGVFKIENGSVKSGTFLIDMKSITVTDIPADDDGNAKLVGHLSGEDFFDVEKFATAAFEVTGYEAGKLSGNLTLKDAENNVTFPVTVTENGDTVSITSDAFTIDRTKWNVQYGSKSIFDDLGDKFINDEIELTVNIKAKKA